MSAPDAASMAPEMIAGRSLGNESIGVRLFKASGLVAIGNISSRLLALVIAVVSARLLTATEFGAVGIIQGTLSMFGITAGLSLGLAATRYVALHRATDFKRARGVALVAISIGSVSNILTSLVMFILAPWLAVHSLHNPELVLPLRWAALQLFLFAEYGLIAGILTGAERFGITATANVFQNIVIILAALLLIPGFRVAGAINAQSLGTAAALILGLWFIRDIFRGLTWRLFRRYFLEDWRLLIDFCLPSVLAGLVIMPASWLALTLIARGPNGYAEIAFFTAADRFRLILFFVSGFVGTALLPILSGAFGKDQSGDRTKALELALFGTAILVLPLSALLSFAGPQMMLLFGRTYQLNWAVLLPVIAWASAGAIGSIVGTALLAFGKQWFLFIQQLLYGLTLVSLAYLMRRLGGTGLALAHLVAVVLLMTLSLPLLRRLNAITPRAVWILACSTIAVCLLCAFAWFCPPTLRLALAGPVTGAVFLLSVLTLGTRYERQRLGQLLWRRQWKRS
jgi:O-antigen/teichoic acid export membrane protein